MEKEMETSGKVVDSGAFLRSITRGDIIACCVMIPLGLIVAGLIGGKGVLVGAAIGFAVAVANAALSVLLMKWALSLEPQYLPMVLMFSYLGRLIALAAIFYGLHFISALDMLAVLFSFLALYVALTWIEIAYAWKTFGAVLRTPAGGEG